MSDDLVKSLTAHVNKRIACTVCGACAWPSDASTRATFGLRYFDPNGVPTSGDQPGEWRCEEHLPQRTRVQRPASASPRAALAELEETFATCFARIENEASDPDDDEDEGGDVVAAVDTARTEIGCALAALRKAIAPPEPAKAKARPKASPTVRLKGQTEMLDASPAAPAPGDSEAAPLGRRANEDVA